MTKIITFRTCVFAEYLEKLRSGGRMYFTSQEIKQNLGLSKDATRAGLYRLKRDGKLISPVNGLYVIVPPEHKPYGSIPAEELMPIMMGHLSAEYYVALLSAAEFYGASHQKPMAFQVITNKRIKHALKFGQIHIKLIYKNSLSSLPIRDIVVSSGYLKISTPELTAIDLLKFPKHAGGMNNIATVLSELMESINGHKLIELAEALGESHQLQRLGYIMEKVDVMNDKIKESIVDALAAYVSSYAKPYVPLSPAARSSNHSRCKKWKIIENTGFESDL